MTSRGIRNNNPGNIRHSKVPWQGEAEHQADPDFVTFVTAEWGLRAIAKILLTYQSRGLETVRQMISRWAPPNENDTPAYVSSVAHQVGVDGDASIDLHNDGLMAKFVAAIVRHENGSQPYTAAQLAAGVRLAHA